MASEKAMEEHRSGCKLPPGYGRLLDRCIEVLGRDQRIRAAWVHGSIARGDADEVSDLDVIIAVADKDMPAFAAGWRDRLDEVTPTVMARPSFGTTGSWLAITPTCQRFDLWVEPASGVASSPVHDRQVLFDRDNLGNLVPPPPAPAPPSPEQLKYLAQRFSSAASVARGAYELLMLQVIWALRWILYNAYVEFNRPLPRTGLKRWSAKLTGAQLTTFVALPTSGDPAPVVAALEDVLGALPAELPEPALKAVVVPPEGFIRGLDIGSVPAGTWGRCVAEEYFALHLYLAGVLHRSDWLLGVVGANDARKLLYELALEANGRRPAASPADWSGRLTSEQRRDLLAIPSSAADRKSVLAAHLAGREIFERRGREILRTSWPGEMEAVVTTHVDRAIASSSFRLPPVAALRTPRPATPP
jgi:Polymerase beta, Nucleotidyltransferase